MSKIARILIALCVASILCLGIIMVAGVLPLFGIGGNQTEHALVSFDVDPSGKSVVFASADGDLFDLDLSTKKVTQLTQTTDLHESNVNISPDGSKIIFAAASDNEAGWALYSIPRLGGEAKRLTNDVQASDYMPQFSPDSSQVVFTRGTRYRTYSMGGRVWDDYDVCVLDIVSGKVTQLTHEKSSQLGQPAFIDGGKSVIFSTRKSVEIVENREGAVPTVISSITPGPHSRNLSDISANKGETKLTYLSDQNISFSYDIFVSNPDLSSSLPLDAVVVSKYNRRPRFAPDGQSIYFLAGEESNGHGRPVFSLYQISLTGTRTRIAGNELFTNPLSWKP